MTDGAEASRCRLCRRAGVEVTQHHLLPRSRSRKRKRRRQSLPDSAPPPDHTVPLCEPCHRMIHATLTTKQLEREYHTIEQLREHPELARFIDWVRRRDPSRRVSVRRTSRRDSS